MMSGRLVRTAAIWAVVLPLAAGCAGARSPDTPAAQLPSPEPAARLVDRQVIRHVLESSVQVVLERNGDRFRTGSGVVIVATPEGTESECLVLSSGHTFAGVNGGDGNETYVLLDRLY